MGDQYESPSQCYTANTQVLQTTLNEVHHEQLANDLTDDSNMKKLTDFIKKRNILKDLSADEEALPDSIPYSAEMGKQSITRAGLKMKFLLNSKSNFGLILCLTLA